MITLDLLPKKKLRFLRDLERYCFATDSKFEIEYYNGVYQVRIITDKPAGSFYGRGIDLGVAIGEAQDALVAVISTFHNQMIEQQNDKAFKSLKAFSAAIRTHFDVDQIKPKE